MQRHYLNPDFKITNWDALKPLLDELKNREIKSAEDLKKWLKDHSELEAVISEDGAWRYIKMTCNTQDEALQNDFNFFVTEIEPHLAPYANDLNKKLVESPFLNALTGDGYEVYIRGVKKTLNYSVKKTFLFKLNYAKKNRNSAVFLRRKASIIMVKK